MIRATLPCRPAGLVFGLIALSSTAGCAHFRDAHERVLREQGQEQHAAAPAAQAAPVAATPTPPPPAPQPQAPVAATPAPVTSVVEPTQPRKAENSARRAAQKAQAAQEAAQIKADRRAERARSKADAKLAQAAPAEAVRQPVFEAPVKASPVPVAPAPAPAPAPIAPPPPPPVASPPAEAATAEAGNAIIMFANVPGARCGACETIKISVQPSGKVLIERGHGAEESWRYKRSIAHVRPERAAAFAVRLAALRPLGKQVAACPAPTTQDQGFNIEWIEAERHDQLSIAPGCGNPSLATLMQAPDLLGLHQLIFPWSSAR